MNSIIKSRNRIASAALHRLHRKTGGNLLVINLPGGEIDTLEITVGFIYQLLLRFEGMAFVEYGRAEGEAVINATYENAIDINHNGEYLTESGKLIVDDLLNEVVNYVKEKHASEGVQ